MSEVVRVGTYPRYYVSSPPKDGRSRKHWVMEHTVDGSPDTAIALANWSYGYSSYATLAEAVEIGRKAQAQYPKRKFRVDLDLDGNAYQKIQEIV